MKVLIADDEEQLIAIYSTVLKNNGFSVVASRDGIETVSKFARERPDLVVLDYNMPGTNGLEAAAEILALDPHVKIIMLTADYSVLKEAKSIGIDLFLVKPISIKILVDSLRSLEKVRPFAVCQRAA